LFESFVNLLDDLEGVHSDEVKANISKRMSELQKEIGIMDSNDDDGMFKISTKVRKTLDDIRGDIQKGFKK
jgi:hypothetical protein